MREFKMVIENTKSDFILLIKSQLKNKRGINFVQEIVLLLLKTIKQTEHIEEAELIFYNLNNIQFVLSEAYFKAYFRDEDMEITPFLKEFIHDYERLDDVEYREYLYKKLKTEP